MLRVARRRRAERFYACGALERLRAARSTRTLDRTLMDVEIVGVYPVQEARQPCHIVEIRVSDHKGTLEIGSFYQPPRRRDKSEQAPYLEYLLNSDGTAGEESFGEVQVDGELRFAFFIHFLENKWRIASPIGVIQLPAALPRPNRLKFMEYSEP